MSIWEGGTAEGPEAMRLRSKPLLARIALVVLLLWGWPAMPAGCPHGGHCFAMHGGRVSCMELRSDSGCCRLRAPEGQIPAETTLGGPAPAPPFLLPVVVPDTQTAARFLSLDQQHALLQSHAPPLFLLHRSLLN